MTRDLLSICRDTRGAAAAEMAMVLPLMLVLLFGTLETGKFFLDEHVVVKAVRDGARYAGRQKFDDMACGGAPDAEQEEAIKDQVRFGVPDAADDAAPRLSYWDDSASITVTVDCLENEEDASTGLRDYAGVYNDRDEVPYVTVTAVVPYEPLARLVGLDFSGFNLVATNQAPVMGI